MTQIYVNFNQAQQKLANIAAIDYFFAKEMVSALSNNTVINEEQAVILLHVFMSLNESLRAGHTCLPVVIIANVHWAIAFDEQGQCSHQGYIFPNTEILTSLLHLIKIEPNEKQPIVFENNKLYLRRYYQFEIELSQGINKRLQHKSTSSLEEVSTIVGKLFPSEKITHEDVSDKSEVFDWQKIAVANAINKRFTVIAGGPGTGKTYTVTKLLAALIMLAQKTVNDTKLDIALVAPTGKAAQRLSESIINAVSGFKGLIDDDVLAILPTQAKTIHRLLGVIPNSPNFRHNVNNQLSCDVLLIDEVSMVDLPMMARIFRALKPDAKVILLGDADQLPSVAVGSVLADIAPRPHIGYSDENLAYLSQVCQLSSEQIKASFEINSCAKTHHDFLSFLVKSRRFDGEGGIGKLATHVIHGNTLESWQLLEASNKIDPSKNQQPNQLTLVNNELSTWLTPLVHQYYQGISKCTDIAEAFSLLAKFRILCVTRQGEFGVESLNEWVKELLHQHYNQSQASYHGMPIMISENDYRLGLFNGDIGLLWQTEDGHLMAFFENADKTTTPIKEKNKKIELSLSNSYKILLPSRLPKFDAVYAMTIHKTQGSEFEHVAIVLPKQADHQLLSRELLYTGITRAKQHLTIASNKQTWQLGVKKAIKRFSGLIL
jgi:exodeoxyribonuclease V alpha subunit